MIDERNLTAVYRVTSDYGIASVLLLLCVYFSVTTYNQQNPTGHDAGEQLAQYITSSSSRSARVVILAGETDDELQFKDTLAKQLRQRGALVVDAVAGGPRDLRHAMEKVAKTTASLDVVACTKTTSRLSFLQDLAGRFPALPNARVVTPATYDWPNFLKTSNLRAVANRVAVIAIIAIGMTMVIITAGIDLSVGSLIAFSAVVAAWLIRAAGQDTASISFPGSWFVVWHVSAGLALIVAGVVLVVKRLWWKGIPVVAIGVCLPYVLQDVATAWVGAIQSIGPTALGMTLSCLTAVLLCGAIGLFSGSMVTFFRIPPFIVTLAMMLVASGLAYIIAENKSIFEIPDSFIWLGREATLGVPNTVGLMLILYAAAHVVMTRTVFGRYVYAAGGNPEAARLSGVPVRRVLLMCYVICGALAGVGGVIRASELKSGEPTYGMMAELEVIAAVVVGGTSLAGGEGKVFGTLIGAFIIGVIRNGMNLTDVESNTQKVVLGLVILAAVLVDKLKKTGWEALKVSTPNKQESITNELQITNDQESLANQFGRRHRG